MPAAFLLAPEGTVWHDGPLTLAVRYGAICYLDEIVEARQDTTVVIHPLTDARRMLPLEKKNELVSAHPDFQLVISYNPGYQSAVKDLKESTKQRFVGIDFDYPAPRHRGGNCLPRNPAPTVRLPAASSTSRCARAICVDKVLKKAHRPAC